MMDHVLYSDDVFLCAAMQVTLEDRDQIVAFSKGTAQVKELDAVIAELVVRLHITSLYA